MNTAVWTTELPNIRLFHHSSLYAVVKGFNAFFGTMMFITIIIICFKIGDHILSIADLRIRANYNFGLFIFSFLVVIFFPFGYVGIARHIGSMLIGEKLTNFAMLTFICFIAIDSLIIFVFAIFLLLTAIMSTLRSYNIFRHLVKLSEEKQKQKSQITSKNIKKRSAPMKTPYYHQYRGHGVYPGRRGVFPTHGVYPHPMSLYHKISEQNSQSSRTSSRLYHVAPLLMQRYGYLITPTLTPINRSPDISSKSSSKSPLSDSTVFLV